MPDEKFLDIWTKSHVLFFFPLPAAAEQRWGAGGDGIYLCLLSGVIINKHTSQCNNVFLQPGNNAQVLRVNALLRRGGGRQIDGGES